MVKKEDLKNAEKNVPYGDFKDRLIKDPVKLMREAGELEMSLSQFANFTCPEVIGKESRSVMAKLRQDEGLFTQNSHLSKASLVEEFFDSEYRQAHLHDVLYNNFYGTRTQITFEADAQPGDVLLPFTDSSPRPDAVGMSLNPGELVANSHEIGTDTYRPFKWEYQQDSTDKNKSLGRSNVNPGATIPATTLGQSQSNIQMEKWGNRFVLPYEMLTGSNMRINKLANMTRLEGYTEEARMFGELIDILEDGDGTPGSAAKSEKLSLYAGTNGTFALNPFLTWIDEALPFPWQISHILMNKAELRKLRALLSSTNANMALEQLVRVGLSPDMSRMNQVPGSIRYGRTPNDELSTGKILGLDSRNAVEYVSRSGMAVRQQADTIANESREVVISDTYLWSKLIFDAVRVLDTNA